MLAYVINAIFFFFFSMFFSVFFFLHDTTTRMCRMPDNGPDEMEFKKDLPIDDVCKQMMK